MPRQEYALLGLLLSSSVIAPNAIAQDSGSSLNDFGMTGLLQMPSARLASADAAWISVTHVNPYRHWSVGAKFTPWLEMTFRQTESLIALDCMTTCFNDYWGGAFKLSSGEQVGRSLDIKILLRKETANFPAIALGFQDMFGSGKFRGEYIVASKRKGPFDLTFGLGWGYLGSMTDISNPMRIFGDKFNHRSQETVGQEQRAHKDWFSGQAIAFFGGVDYQTPVEGLSIKAEWSSIDPTNTFEPVARKRSFPIGVGFNWNPRKWLSSGLAFEDGNRVMFRLSLSADLTRALQPKPIYSTQAVARYAQENAVVQGASPEDKILTVVQGHGFTIITQEIDADRMFLYLSGPDSRSPLDVAKSLFVAMGSGVKRIELAINNRETVVITRSMVFDTDMPQPVEPSSEKGPSVRALSIELPTYASVVDAALNQAIIEEPQLDGDIKLINVSVRDSGIELAEISFVRAHIAKFEKGVLTGRELLESSRIYAGPNVIADDDGTRTKVRWAIGPYVEEQLGGDSLAKADIYARAKASVSFDSGFMFDAGVRQRIAGNLDTLAMPVDDGTFPIVRSDLISYLDQDNPVVDRMALSMTRAIGDNLFVKAQAGIMESQYSAVGAELLYMPSDTEWAVGGAFYYAKKRRAGSVFGSDDYDVATGHVTLYREFSKYAATAKLSAGRYLGGDWGTTLDLSREFDSGIKLGIYTTLTNADKNGVSGNNFVKGAYLKLPLNLFWGNERGEPFSFDFRKLLHDAGQKLNTGRSFYGQLQSGRHWRIRQSWPK